MKQYTVIREFWRNGIVQPVGKVITMVEAEAKYIAHAVEEKVAEVQAAVKKAEAPKPAATVAATEAPANGQPSK